MKVNTTLAILDLSKNIRKTSEKVISAISEAIKVNTTLTKLNLCCNRIKNEDEKVIEEALKANTTLKLNLY